VRQDANTFSKHIDDYGEKLLLHVHKMEDYNETSYISVKSSALSREAEQVTFRGVTTKHHKVDRLV
jgi:hypothetical protein